MKNLIYTGYLVLVSLLLTEAALWLLGYRPYRHEPFSIRSEPQFCLLPDSMLGFRLNPGAYRITLNDHQSFTATHDSQGRRISGFEEQTRPIPIHLHGCSYTYGWGIDDSLSLGFQLQRGLPRATVTDFAVPGYGTVQAYLLLKASVQAGNTPQLAIISYSSLHEDRNALTPSFRRDLHLGFALSNPRIRSLYPSFRYPYAALAGDRATIGYAHWSAIYENWPLRTRSALVNHLQTSADRFRSFWYRKKEVTRQLFRMIRSLCDHHGITLVVACVTDDPATKSFAAWCRDEKINVLEMEVDVRQKEWHNYPFDTHPNARAHKRYAAKLKAYLRPELEKMSVIVLPAGPERTFNRQSLF